MAVIARCGHCNLPVLDSESRIFDGEQMYHQAHYAEAMRNQRDEARRQLRGAVEERDTLREALRVINEHTLDPFARRVVAEALASLTAHGGQ